MPPAPVAPAAVDRFGPSLSATDRKADLNRRAARGGVVTLSGQALRLIVQIGSTMVLARLLTPGDFGLVAMGLTATSFAMVFKDAGLSIATIQRAEVSHEQISNLFWANVVISAALMLVVAALSPLVAMFYQQPALIGVTTGLSLVFVFGGLAVQHKAILTRQMRFGALTGVVIGSQAGGVAVAIAMAIAGFGYWSLVGLAVGQAAVECVLVWLLCDWKPGRPQRGVGTKSMIHFGSFLTAFNVLNYATRNADNVMLGAIWGASQLGIYSKAYALLLLPLRQINAPIASVSVPALSRLQDEPEAFRQFYQRMVRLISYATMPLVVVLAVLAEEITGVVLGPGWEESAVVFRVLAFFGVVQSVSVTTGWVLTSLGNSRRMFEWNVIGTPTIVIAFALGLPYGAYGVALAATIAALVLSVPQIFYAFRGTPASMADIVRASGPPLILAMAIFGTGETARRLAAPHVAEIAASIASSTQAITLPVGILRHGLSSIIVGVVAAGLMGLWFALLPSAREEVGMAVRMLRKRKSPAGGDVP
ncbi:MAG: lipopolysaccharide biosynthesis protein [Planctomycetota bacterium]